MSIPGLTIIGERINPGFRSTQALFDNEDIKGIQALAVRQAEAGSAYLNVNCGAKAITDCQFMVDVVQALQDVVDIPLSFDCPDLNVQRRCLEVYDDKKASGEKPLINSIAETRWEMVELLNIRPCKVLLMSSERMESDRKVPNKFGSDVYDVTKRMMKNIKRDFDLKNNDFIVDVSVSAVAADFEGLIRMALEGIDLIRKDPELEGVHISGGLSNLTQQMPKLAADGTPLAIQLENAFLTLAVPRGFDYVLGTPWREYELLPESNAILQTLKEFVVAEGFDAMHVAKKFYKAS